MCVTLKWFRDMALSLTLFLSDIPSAEENRHSVYNNRVTVIQLTLHTVDPPISSHHRNAMKGQIILLLARRQGDY